jgi:AcrR family transcriptional regulator
MSAPTPPRDARVGEGILVHPSGARSERVHEQVLAATAALLDEGGCSAATVDAISARSGVSKATIYKHWPSRNAVAAKAFGRMMASDTPLPNTGTTAGDVTELLRRLSAFYQSPRGRIFAQLIAACAVDPAGAPYFRAYFLAGEREAISTLWARARERDDVDPSLSIDDVVDILLGPLVFRLLTGHVELTEENATRLAETALAGLLRPERKPTVSPAPAAGLPGGDRQARQGAQVRRQVEHHDRLLLGRIGAGDHRDGVSLPLIHRQVRRARRHVQEIPGAQRRAAAQPGSVPDLDLAARDPDRGLVPVVQVRRAAGAGRNGDHVQAQRLGSRRGVADSRAQAQSLLPVVMTAAADDDAARPSALHTVSHAVPLKYFPRATGSGTSAGPANARPAD